MDALAELAAAHGVAHEYWDWRNQHVLVPEQTLRAVLAALDVDTSDPAAALEATPVGAVGAVAARATSSRPRDVRAASRCTCADGAAVDVWLELEDGTRHAGLRQLRELDAAARRRRGVDR